jgi:hypothetical protein
MYKKYKYKDMYLEYRDGLNGETIFKKMSILNGPTDVNWLPTHWTSWDDVINYAKVCWWEEVNKPITEIDYLNAFKFNFKDGG